LLNHLGPTTDKYCKKYGSGRTCFSLKNLYIKSFNIVAGDESASLQAHWILKLAPDTPSACGGVIHFSVQGGQ
jgi:hypothetical protein